MRDRYERIIREQQYNQLKPDREQPAKHEQQSAGNQSLLDSMITTRLVGSKLTRVNEIDRQINTFVIAGK